ncbi:hypothetical protein, partial [Bacillus cereus]|uniref:hypothetical protein n=1 Tax=Bacillus cereus TaxID=1396 RepID=UPI0034D5E85A
TENPKSAHNPKNWPITLRIGRKRGSLAETQKSTQNPKIGRKLKNRPKTLKISKKLKNQQKTLKIGMTHKKCQKTQNRP